MPYSLIPELSTEVENLPRRERKNLQQRGEILQAALKLFSEKGYHNVSMHDIAKEAEFGIGTLYKYFGNKEELYKAIIYGGSEKFHKTILRALEDEKNPVQAIKKHIAIRRKLFLDDLPLVRLYFGVTRGAGFSVRAGFDGELRRRHDKFLEKLASVFEKGIKEDLFRALDPYYMALALDGIINTFLFRIIEDPDRFREKDNLSIAMDIFLEGVLKK